MSRAMATATATTATRGGDSHGDDCRQLMATTNATATATATTATNDGDGHGDGDDPGDGYGDGDISAEDCF